MKKVERVITAEAAKVIGCTPTGVARAFKDSLGVADDVDNVEAEVKGVRVIRHLAKPNEGGPRTKHVYTIPEPPAPAQRAKNEAYHTPAAPAAQAKKVEAKKPPEKPETPATPAVEDTEESLPPTKTTSNRWTEVARRVDEAEEQLKRVAQQLSDIAVISDDELWAIIAQERKIATSTLDVHKADLAKVAYEERHRLHWLSDEEVRALQAFRRQVAIKTATPAQEAVTGNESTALSPWEAPAKPTKPERRALLYGGNVSPHICRRFEKEFGFDEVVYQDGKRKVMTEAERVKRGEYEAVFVFGEYASHDLMWALKGATKENSTKFVCIPHGKSTKQARLIYDDRAPHGSRGDVNVSARN